MVDSVEPPLLDPVLLTAMAELELQTRSTVAGLGIGRHRGRRHGQSVEYIDHRAYTAGDEPHTIDWKLLGRTDKYYVKLFEAESNLKLQLILDLSLSMGFASQEISKYRFSIQLLAALAMLLLQQRDAVALHWPTTSGWGAVPASSASGQWERLARSMCHLQPQTGPGWTQALLSLPEHLPSGGWLVLCSDWLDDLPTLWRALRGLLHSNRKLFVLHLIDPAEADFPYSQETIFRDPETKQTLRLHARRQRDSYLQRWQQFCRELQSGCHDLAIPYLACRTDQPILVLLRQWLRQTTWLR